MSRRCLFWSALAVGLTAPVAAQRRTVGPDPRDLYLEPAAEDKAFPPQAEQDKPHSLRRSRDIIRSNAADVAVQHLGVRYNVLLSDAKGGPSQPVDPQRI